MRALAAASCAVAALAVLPAAAPGKASWSAPRALSGTSATEATAAIDARGNAFVMWSRLVGRATDRRIEFAVRPRGARFRRAEVPPSQATGDRNSPVAVVYGTGGLAAAWSTGVSGLQLALRAPERRFVTSPKIPSTESAPALAARASGETVAAWRADSGIEVAVRGPGGGFGASRTVSAPIAPDSLTGSPHVALNAAGDAAVAWGVSGVERAGGPGPGLYVSVRPRGGEFGAPERVPYPAGTSAGDVVDNFAQQAALTASGELLVTWESGQDFESLFHTWVAARSRGGAFITQRLSRQGYGSELAVDARGYGYVAFNVIDADARFAARAPGRPFGRSRPFAGGDISLPDLATDGGGTLHAVWIERGRVLAARRPRGRGFGRATVISGARRTSSFPSLAVNRAGEAVAAWEESLGRFAGAGPTEVRAALFRPR